MKTMPSNILCRQLMLVTDCDVMTVILIKEVRGLAMLDGCLR